MQRLMRMDGHNLALLEATSIKCQTILIQECTDLINSVN